MKTTVSRTDIFSVPQPSLRRPSPRRLVLTVLTAATSAVLVAPGAVPATAAYSSCPGPEALVSKATWHSHKLATGVVLREGQAKDNLGIVDMHVLQIDVTSSNLRFGPLIKHVAQRSPLTSLAAGHSRLVAATNTGYFDFQAGVPTAPVIDKNQFITGTSNGQGIVGINTKGRFQAGKVWVHGHAYSGGSSYRITGMNALHPPDGLTIYNPRWGSRRVPMRWNSVSRYVVGGIIKTGPGHQYDAVHSTGILVVANGWKAKNWLNGLKVGKGFIAKVSVGTNTTLPFTQGYGVGIQLVMKPGAVRTGLACRYPITQPARTAIGWTDLGRKLIIAVVTDHPNTNVHGLDQKQMSGLMVQLGADRAFGFDGSGSSELLAKMPGTSTLSLRNYPADGAERPMPVGFGIYSH